MLHDLIEKAWTDEAFKRRLIESPGSVLSPHGIASDPGARIVIHENTADVMHLVLPEKAEVDGVPLRNFGEGLGEVLRRAWDDPSFRARLVENPSAAIADATGFAAPSSIRLVIHCDTSDAKHFVLPVNTRTDALRERNRYLIGGSMQPPRWGR